MINDIITLENQPDIKLIDEEKTVTISIYTYNKLLFDSFKLNNAKSLYEVTKEKLDNILDIINNNADSYEYVKDIRKKITNIYYDIKEEEDE